MKLSKEIYLQFFIGLVLVAIYAFFKYEGGNSYALIAAIDNFKNEENKKLEIRLLNRLGQEIYNYSNSNADETNQHFIALIAESRVVDRYSRDDYCIDAFFAAKRFRGCFAAEDPYNNQALGVLLKILSLNT